MQLSKFAFFSVISFLGLAANAEAAVDLQVQAPPLKYTWEAPAEIARAGAAIVQVESGGTGFFISGDGLMVTNRHVVGPEECALNGCFLELKRNFIGGNGKPDVALYFATPVVTVPELDASVLQIWASPPTERHLAPTNKLMTPEFLTSAKDAQKGEEVFVLGFPFGGVQRWSKGPLHSVRGDWRGAEILVIPGMSGSPVLNSDGKIVGLIHRSVTDGKAVTDLNVLRPAGFFTSWSAFDAFWSHRDMNKNQLPGYATVPTDAVVKSEAFGKFFLDSDGPEGMLSLMMMRRQNQVVIDVTEPEENAEEAPKKKKSKKKKAAEPETETFSAAETLLSICEMEIEEDDGSDPDNDYPLCSHGLTWMECRKDVPARERTPIFGVDENSKEKWDYTFCPDEEDQEEWNKHFAHVAEMIELNNHDPLTFISMSAGIFAKSEAERLAAVKTQVDAFLARHAELAPLEKVYGLSLYESDLSKVVLGDLTLDSALSNYTTAPGISLFYEDFLSAYEHFLERGVFTPEKALELAKKITQDPKMPMDFKFDIEVALLTGHAELLRANDSKRSRLSRNSKKTGSPKIHKRIGEIRVPGRD